MTPYKFEAAFVGRFQPFHNGHLKAIKGILEKHKNLLIIIGSTQESRTDKNPFDFKLRESMIRGALIDAGYDMESIEIVALPDINDDARWVAYLIDSVPSFEIMYTGSENTRRLFEKYGKVKIAGVNYLQGVSGTMVREYISRSKSIDGLVPKRIVEILQI